MKRFSVVMPVRNPDPERMRFALASIRSAQIIIVDDASDDPDIALSLGAEFGAAVYREDAEKGLVAAVNYGISRADGEYVHVLPPDCWVLNGFHSTVDLMIRTHGFKALVATRWLAADEMGRAVESFSDRLPKPGEALFPPCAFVARRDWYELNPWPDLPFDEAATEVVRRGTGQHILINWPLACCPLRPPSVLTL